MSFAKHMAPDHLKTVRMLGYTLTLDDADAWHGFTLALGARLDERQRAALAWAALRSLEPQNARQVVETVLPRSAPIAPFLGYMDEAAFWADMAESDALDAYCLACFNALSAPRKSAFLEYVQGRVAA